MYLDNLQIPFFIFFCDNMPLHKIKTFRKAKGYYLFIHTFKVLTEDNFNLKIEISIFPHITISLTGLFYFKKLSKYHKKIYKRKFLNKINCWEV